MNKQQVDVYWGDLGKEKEKLKTIKVLEFFGMFYLIIFIPCAILFTLNAWVGIPFYLLYLIILWLRKDI